MDEDNIHKYSSIKYALLESQFHLVSLYHVVLNNNLLTRMYL